MFYILTCNLDLVVVKSRKSDRLLW